MGGEQADDRHEHAADAEGERAEHAELEHGVIGGGAGDGGEHIHMLLQHHGHAADELIAHDAAAHARHGADEHGEEGVAAVAGLHGGVHADGDEDAKAHGVERVDQRPEPLEPLQEPFAQAQRHDERHQRHAHGRGHIPRIDEHGRRQRAQQDIADDAAAHARNRAEHERAEHVELTRGGHHHAGDGERRDTDHLQHKDQRFDLIHETLPVYLTRGGLPPRRRGRCGPRPSAAGSRAVICGGTACGCRATRCAR